MKPFERTVREIRRCLNWQISAAEKYSHETGDDTVIWTLQQIDSGQRHTNRYSHLLRRLTHAAKHSRRTTRQKLQSEILTSQSAKFTSALRVLTGFKRRVTFLELSEFVASLSLDSQYTDVVTVRPLPPTGVNWRPIAHTGKLRRAQQLIWRDVLLARLGDSPCDSTVAGAGGEREFLRKLETLIAEGYRYAASIDIIKFFPSVKPGHLVGFPISSWAIENVAYLPPLTPIVFVDPTKNASFSQSDLTSGNSSDLLSGTLFTKESVLSKLNMVRHGLPQGDVLSPLIARAFLGREIQHALGKRDVRWFTHLDDCLICASSRSKLRSAIKALANRLSKLPAGPIELKIGAIRHIDEHFYHLGYRISLRDDGSLYIRPAVERFERFRRRLFDLLRRSSSFSKEQLLCGALVYARQWFDSQSAWTKAKTNGKSRYSGKSWDYVVAEVRDCVDRFIYSEYIQGYGGWTEADVDLIAPEAEANDAD